MKSADEIRRELAALPVEQVLDNPMPTVPRSAVPLLTGAADLARDDAVLFSHAIFFTVGGLDVDPVVEWAVQRDRVGSVDVLVSGTPIFKGLEFPKSVPDAEAWNYRLMRVGVENWADLGHYLSGVQIIDRKRKFFATAFRHEVSILDPFYRGTRLLKVYGFGLSSTNGLYWLEHDILTPRLRRLEPEEKTLRESSRYFREML